MGHAFPILVVRRGTLPVGMRTSHRPARELCSHKRPPSPVLEVSRFGHSAGEV